MKKSIKKTLAGMTGAATLLSGAVCVVADEVAVPSLETREEEAFNTIENVQGEFHFHQDELTPSDDVFSLFGTVATAACAKPGFAFNGITEETYYVNVKGAVKKAFTLNLDQIKAREKEEVVLKCSCSSGMALATTLVTGTKVSDVLQMAEIEEGANTVTFRSADGYGIPMPLQYVLDKEALLVYKIGDRELTAENGGQLQVWMPDTVARYFTRQVTQIEVSKEESIPDVVQPENTYQVSILNRFRDNFKVGDQIGFEGYADDFNTRIIALEFSMDNGKTWSSYETPDTTSRLWVYWHFDYTTQAAGKYKLDVRAVAADGSVSPLASSMVFTVE